MLRCFFLARNATCCEVQFIAGDRKKPGERKGPLKLARDRTLHSNVLNRKGFWVAKRMKQFFGAVEYGSQLKGSSGSPRSSDRKVIAEVLRSQSNWANRPSGRGRSGRRQGVPQGTMHGPRLSTWRLHPFYPPENRTGPDCDLHSGPVCVSRCDSASVAPVPQAIACGHRKINKMSWRHARFPPDFAPASKEFPQQNLCQAAFPRPFRAPKQFAACTFSRSLQ